MEFVTFHVQLNSDEATHPNCNLELNQYADMISMMFASARLFDPTCITTVISDHKTNLDLIKGNVNQYRVEIDSKNLMLERTLAQSSYISKNLTKSHPIIILDSDILINSSLEGIFDLDFDIALTWRPNETMPINGGFLILNSIRPQVTIDFFNKFKQIYLNRYIDAAAWYGDQLALRDCVGEDILANERFEVQKILTVDGCKILLLPCEKFNYSPKNRFSSIVSGLQDKVILHFKGERKQLMPYFWNARLIAKINKSPISFIVQWKTRLIIHWNSMRESKSSRRINK